MSITKKLIKNDLFKVQQPFVGDVVYEVIMGSFAYGVSNDTSDIDVYGVCIPPKEYVFPHTAGYIDGFGERPQNFHNAQQHHLKMDDKEYDVSIYSIVSFFQLCADNNPNMIDSLFVPDRCITSINNIGKVMRENRKLFLHKGAYHRFKGYAYSQLKKLKNKKPTGKRKELVDAHGYDVKFSYHIVRLANECEQILISGDLNLEKSKEQLKAVRRGEWTLEELEQWFKTKEALLDELYIKSDIQHSPNYSKLQNVLLACLEEHYGSLSGILDTSGTQKAISKLQQIEQIINS